MIRERFTSPYPLRGPCRTYRLNGARIADPHKRMRFFGFGVLPSNWSIEVHSRILALLCCKSAILSSSFTQKPCTTIANPPCNPSIWRPPGD